VGKEGEDEVRNECEDPGLLQPSNRFLTPLNFILWRSADKCNSDVASRHLPSNRLVRRLRTKLSLYTIYYFQGKLSSLKSYYTDEKVKISLFGFVII
jgi:hypothetical protein